MPQNKSLWEGMTRKQTQAVQVSIGRHVMVPRVCSVVMQRAHQTTPCAQTTQPHRRARVVQPQRAHVAEACGDGRGWQSKEAATCGGSCACPAKVHLSSQTPTSQTSHVDVVQVWRGRVPPYVRVAERAWPTFVEKSCTQGSAALHRARVPVPYPLSRGAAMGHPLPTPPLHATGVAVCGVELHCHRDHTR